MSTLGIAYETVVGCAVDIVHLLRLEPGSPHSWIKYQVLKKLGRRTHARTFIEVGTLHGVTTRRAAAHFEFVHTIELDRELARRAREFLSGLSNVELHEGDAVDVLPEILRSAVPPAVVFLDGHYSGDGTAHGKYAEPACVEIVALAAARDKIGGFVVDDFRCFGREAGWPTKAALIESVEQHFSEGFAIDVRFDQVIVERQAPTPV